MNTRGRSDPSHNAVTASLLSLFLILSLPFLFSLITEQHLNQTDKGNQRPEPEADKCKQRMLPEHVRLIKPITDPHRNDLGSTPHTSPR